MPSPPPRPTLARTSTIPGCQAGKHVYGKPGSHNVAEAELMVAARKHDRHVQMGNQRRSYPVVMEACSGCAKA